MRKFRIPLAVLLLSAFSVAKSAEEPLDALKARAQNAKPQEQAHLFATVATEAARKSGKHLKDTEILLRATARRLDDVGRTLNFDDRPYVQTAVKQVEKLRQQLLDHMFGAPSKDKQ
jgi:hypothetical protein